MTLHHDTEKLIAEGPQQVPIGKDGVGVETYGMFARRIAQHAVEKEREAAIKRHDQSACSAEIESLRYDIERHVAIAASQAEEIAALCKERDDLLGPNPVEAVLMGQISALRAENERLREDAERMKSATYSHVDGRDLLHELQPNGAHHIDIVVRINGQDRRYEGDWLKNLTYARDGHNMGEYADSPKLRAMIEAARAEATSAQVPTIGMGIDAAGEEGK